MNKESGSQQPFFQPRWFIHGPNQEVISQEMSTVIIDPLTNKLTLRQKDIQAILLERGLWSQGGVQLECEKPKCFNSQILLTCFV